MSKKTTIEPGDECWLEDGSAAIYAGEVSGQGFVHLCLTSEDGEPFVSERLTPVGSIFAEEPAAVYGPKTTAAREKFVALQKQQAALTEEVAALERRRGELQAAADKYPDIQRVVDFLEGRFKYVVSFEWDGPEVMTFSEALEADGLDGWRKEGVKLACLSGSPFGGVDFVLNSHQDGRGSWKRIVPAKTEDECREIIRQVFEESLAEKRKSGARLSPLEKYARGPYGVTLPADVADEIKKQKADVRAKRIEQARAELKRLEEED